MINWLDLVVLAVAALAGWRGWRTGGLITVIVIGGRVAGTVVGLAVAHLIAGRGLDFPLRVLLEVLAVVAGWMIGGRLAARLIPLTRGRPTASRRPALPDRIVGVTLRAGVAVVVGALALQALALWGPPTLKQTAEASALHVGLSGVWAGAVPSGSAGTALRSTLPPDLTGFLPDSQSSGEQITLPAAAASVYPITATTPGSSVSSTGTGFAVGPNEIVTAYHVVAAAAANQGRISVGSDGDGHTARLALSDQHNDIAILLVTGLDAKPLAVSSSRSEPGQAVTFVGFPDGGPKTARSARIGGAVAAPVLPGAAGGPYLRPVYRLDAVVRPGNSGGPLIDSRGAVIGIIDSRSLLDSGTGYAITAEPLRADLAAVGAPAASTNH